jgi:hypothetical protein
MMQKTRDNSQTKNTTYGAPAPLPLSPPPPPPLLPHHSLSLFLLDPIFQLSYLFRRAYALPPPPSCSILPNLSPIDQ